MLYDNWIHKLSENYVNSRLGINEEQSGQHHPMVHKAADFIHSILDTYHGNHPKEKTLNSITRSLEGQEVTRDSVVNASHDAINDHYGLEGLSYDVNPDVAGDHSERRDYDKLLDRATEHVQDKLWSHLGEPEEPEKKQVEESTLTESEMILEELNETKEYVHLLENILNELLENEIITEMDIKKLIGAAAVAGSCALGAVGCGKSPPPPAKATGHVSAGVEGQLIQKPNKQRSGVNNKEPRMKGAGAEGEL